MNPTTSRYRDIRTSSRLADWFVTRAHALTQRRCHKPLSRKSARIGRELTHACQRRVDTVDTLAQAVAPLATCGAERARILFDPGMRVGEGACVLGHALE